MKKLFLFLKLSFQNYSLLRIFQIIEICNIKLEGKTIEFGANRLKKKNFSFYIDEKIKVDYSNIFSDKSSEILYADLTKKLKISSNKYKNIIIFNVLEHLHDHKLTFKELYRILKKKGSIVGSTPFLYQVHGAPKDYFRFSKDFLIFILKKHKYTNIKVICLGYGPFIASYNLLYSYLKFLPLINQIILLLCYLFDTFIQLFVKTDLKEIYPIGFFFSSQK
jgi:SAM-dependent methyltransferase